MLIFKALYNLPLWGKIKSKSLMPGSLLLVEKTQDVFLIRGGWCLVMFKVFIEKVLYFVSPLFMGYASIL